MRNASAGIFFERFPPGTGGPSGPSRYKAEPNRGIAAQSGGAVTMSKMLSLIAGISVLVLAGTASAGGPVSLTNSQMGVVTAGATPGLDFTKHLKSTSDNNVKFKGYSDISHEYNKQAYIDVNSRVKGNSATLDFDNEAVGKNSNVQGTLSQITIAGQGSSQAGSFVSAANARVYTPRSK